VDAINRNVLDFKDINVFILIEQRHLKIKSV